MTTTEGQPKCPRKNTMTTSPNVLGAMIARRTKKPVVLDQLKSYRSTIQPARFKHLNVDETYQRVRLTEWVNDLIHTIKAGGFIPDPIAVAERPDGSLWIVDGQQRYWASLECGVPLEATVYKVPDPKTDDYATERKLFYVLNRTRNLTVNRKVAAWSGHITTLMHRVEAAGAYPHKIGYNTPGHHVYNPSTLVRSVVALLTAGGQCFEDLDSVLRHSETLLASKEAQAKAQAFLLIIPRVWPTPKDARYLAVAGLARVAAARWRDGVKVPSQAVLTRIGRVNVAGLTSGSYAARFLPIVIATYEQRWPAAS